MGQAEALDANKTTPIRKSGYRDRFPFCREDGSPGLDCLGVTVGFEVRRRINWAARHRSLSSREPSATVVFYLAAVAGPIRIPPDFWHLCATAVT